MRTAVCCILKNENHYIREWVEWYKNIGFTNAILYDNNDIDGETLDDVISDYINEGFVIVKDVRGKTKQQLPCYQSCYDEYSNDYDWIAFFDADEFLEFDNNKNVDDFLNEDIFKDAEFIKICWKNFNDNGLVNIENDDFSIKRFTQTIEEKSQTSFLANRSTKIITRTKLPGFKFFMEPGGEHGWYLPFKSVDCHGNVCDNNTQVISERIWDNAWLNHYRFRTVEEFCKLKLTRLYPHCDANMGKLMLGKKDFFDYNEWTQEKDDLYHKYAGNDVICCIFNYNHDGNAVVWYNRCRNNYKTFLLDSYHFDNGDVDKFPIHNNNTIFLENIYCGGLTIKAMELLKEFDGKYLMIINSDVVCDNQNFDALTRAVFDVIDNGNIGVWEPSANENSSLRGVKAIISQNIHQFCHGTNGMRDVVSGEGWFELLNRSICDWLYPHINKTDNKYGWGINDACSRIARKLGLRVVIDDRVVMEHTGVAGYNAQEADVEYAKFKEKFNELGLHEKYDEPNINMKTMVCCIGRNENRYAREFVDWYKNLGITNICLYDNNFDGEEDFNDVLKQDIDNGFIIYNDWRNKQDCQMDAYNDCYSRFGDDYDWILFIDFDEFFESPKFSTINEYLSQPQFINFDMIHLNYLTVGDNGLVKYDERPLHVRFPEEIDITTKVAYDFPENFHVKSIVAGGLNDIKFNKTGWSHTPISKTARCCNDVGFTVDSNTPFCNMDFTLAYFRHYVTKTAEEYADKMKRGFPDQIWDGSRIADLIATRFFKINTPTKEKVEVFKEAFGLDFSYLIDKPYDGPKSDEVKIYSLCFSKKNFKFIDDKYVTPLQVGAANGADVCVLKDNIGDNISGINYFFIENTGTYWIWKNVHGAKYKGQMQYRRPLFGVNENMDIDKLFEQFDVITCSPFYHKENNTPTPQQPMCIPANTVEEGYAFSNCIDDLYVLEMVIKMNFPEYADDYDKYIKNSDRLYYSNGFIMRAQDFDNYASFLFACLNLYAQMTNIRTPQDLVDHVKYNLEVGKYPRYRPQDINDGVLRWQCSICGFLSERIWTLWVQHHFHHTRICELPYIKMEPDKMYT